MTACVSGTLRDVGAGSGINGRGGSGARTKSRAASHPATDGRADLQPSTDPPPSVLPQRKAVPTMRDIAAAAKVSQSTVSRVLNNAPTRVPIAEETRERVTLAARRLGYRPNPLARGLRGAPTMLLGAVVRDITDPFFAGAIEALSIEAMARGYNVVLGHAQGRTDQALALTAVLETRHCDAIVLLGDMQDQPRLLADLRTSLVPVVALWQGSSLLEVPTVDVDNVAGVRAGLEHLVDLGHKRIAFVSGRHLGDIREREAAFIDFMTERFGGVDPAYVRQVPNTPSGGESALGVLLDLPEPPTAIMTSTDTLAFGVLHAAYSLGRTVPDAAVGGGLRRHPAREPHGAGADHAADADGRDRGRGRPAGHRVRARRQRRPAAGGQGDQGVADRPPVDGTAGSLTGPAARFPVAEASSRIARRRFITSLPPRPK